MDYEKELNDLVESIISQKGSDIHLSEGHHPIIRISTQLTPVTKKNPLTNEDIAGYLKQMLEGEQLEELKKNRSIDFAYSHRDEARFRGNAYYQKGKVSIALRLIPQRIRSLEELNIPDIIGNFARKKQGFFLVVGPTGHGKSTTLASLIDIVNSTRLAHIITIEDPIEYIHNSKESIIDQRQIGDDATDFSSALRHIFRQDADVVMVGEMRDRETISTAVTAAETGHLILSTLHTNTASQTVDRIIDSFPPDQQDQIRLQLAGSLIGILSQRLLPRTSGGLIPAYELLIANRAVANLIRENRSHEIDTVIQTSSQDGMIDMNRSLADLVTQGEITVEDAYRFTTDSKSLERLL